MAPEPSSPLSLPLTPRRLSPAFTAFICVLKKMLKLQSRSGIGRARLARRSVSTMAIPTTTFKQPGSTLAFSKLVNVRTGRASAGL